MSESRMLLFWAMLVMTACGGGGGSNNGAVLDTTPPTMTSNLPGNGVPILGGATIEVRFSEAMNTATLDLGGDLQREMAGYDWSSSQADNDTLTFHPNAAWVPGFGKTLWIQCSDLAGNAMDAVTITTDVVAGTLYYVSAAQPDDSGDGLTPGAAKRTIMAAVSAATPPASIFVAAGDYDVTYPANHVVLTEGVSLYGGFNTDFTVRDSDTLLSSIRDISSGTGSNYLNPSRVVDAGSGITDATVFDGFRVLSGSTTNSGECAAAIFAHDGAAPIISRNLIKGGTGERTNGVAIYQAAPLIRGNTIYSGEATNWSFGIESNSASPIIVNNLIAGGGAGTISYGIEFSGDAVIRNNTINGGSDGMYSTAINFIQPATNAVIENNILFTTGGSYQVCIGEGNDTSPGTIRNNDFFGCPTAFYADTLTSGTGNCPFSGGMNCYTTIVDVNDPALTTQGTTDSSSGNVAIIPAFADIDGVDNDISTIADNDWHFATDGSAPCGVTAGGLNGNVEAYGFWDDKEGNTRTSIWSIGAYEFDGSCQ